MNQSEVLASIKSAEARVREIFAELTPQQLQQQVHEEPGGWTASQLLAHLTGNRERMQQFLAPDANWESLYGDAFETWNQQWVVERDGASLSELLGELEEQNALACADIERLGEAELNRVVPSRSAEMPLIEMFHVVCARHCLSHSAVVASALKLEISDPA
jgi:hypothetical protein